MKATPKKTKVKATACPACMSRLHVPPASNATTTGPEAMEVVMTSDSSKLVLPQLRMQITVLVVRR